VSPIEWDNVVLYGQYILDRKLVRRRRRGVLTAVPRGVLSHSGCSGHRGRSQITEAPEKAGRFTELIWSAAGGGHKAYLCDQRRRDSRLCKTTRHERVRSANKIRWVNRGMLSIRGFEPRLAAVKGRVSEKRWFRA
jgi:hypothetical protein